MVAKLDVQTLLRSGAAPCGRGRCGGDIAKADTALAMYHLSGGLAGHAPLFRVSEALSPRLAQARVFVQTCLATFSSPPCAMIA
jgi:hypothetical protein